jgi:hypothetical protein
LHFAQLGRFARENNEHSVQETCDDEHVCEAIKAKVHRPSSGESTGQQCQDMPEAKIETPQPFEGWNTYPENLSTNSVRFDYSACNKQLTEESSRLFIPNANTHLKVIHIGHKGEFLTCWKTSIS